MVIRRQRLPLGLVSGLVATRFLVEFVRIDDPALFGLTQPQLWSLLAVAIGAGILLAHRSHAARPVDT